MRDEDPTSPRSLPSKLELIKTKVACCHTMVDHMKKTLGMDNDDGEDCKKDRDLDTIVGVVDEIHEWVDDLLRDVDAVFRKVG